MVLEIVLSASGCPQAELDTRVRSPSCSYQHHDLIELPSSTDAGQRNDDQQTKGHHLAVQDKRSVHSVDMLLGQETETDSDIPLGCRFHRLDG